jgi:hypothetical protein
VDLITQIWERATTTQEPPSGEVVLLTAGVALVCLIVPTLWHLTRHVLTIVHESAHATVAVLTGRRLAGVRLHSDTSGLTLSVGKPRGPGMIAMAFAGYTGPAVLGLAAAWVLGRGYAVGLLWLLVVALGLLLVQIRNWYGLWTVLVSLAALVAITWWATPVWQSGFAYALTWFLLLGAPRAVVELQTSRRRSRGTRTSDADILANLTHVPGLVWVGAFLVVTVGALAWAATLLVG